MITLAQVLALIVAKVGLPSPFFKGLSIGTIPDYTDFEDDGFVVAYGDAQGWDDLRSPLTASKQGIQDKPDFDYTNIGLLFPQNDAAEQVSIVTQMPHNYAEGTIITPHIHWQQSAATAVTWKMEYKWFNLDEAVPASFTALEVSVPEFSYVSGDLMQVSNFGDIDGTGKLISSFLLVRIFRDDNTTSDDVLAFEFDIHYKKNTKGSRQPFAK